MLTVNGTKTAVNEIFRVYFVVAVVGVVDVFVNFDLLLLFFIVIALNPSTLWLLRNFFCVCYVLFYVMKNLLGFGLTNR